jgi:hypothetical protein
VFQGYSKAKARLDELSGVAHWTLRDLRRTIVSGMARLGPPPRHVADKILNHQSGTISGVAAVYQRHEFMLERQAALDRWGEHVSELMASSSLAYPTGTRPSASSRELTALGIGPRCAHPGHSGPPDWFSKADAPWLPSFVCCGWKAVVGGGSAWVTARCSIPGSSTWSSTCEG